MILDNAHIYILFHFNNSSADSNSPSLIREKRSRPNIYTIRASRNMNFNANFYCINKAQGYGREIDYQYMRISIAIVF